jgi:hypothetical protein
MLTVEELLVLDGVRSWQAVCSRRLLYPVDPFQGRQLDVIEPLPGPVAADQLGLEQPDVGLGQGVVQRVANAADAGCGAAAASRSVNAMEVYFLGSTGRCNTCLVEQP